MRQILTLALILAITTLPALAQTDRQLVDRYDSSVNAKRYKAALISAQQIVDRYPESATWQFNLGSMHARLGETQPALDALKVAVDLGYTGVRSFEHSEDLDPLRDNREFKQILAKVQSNAAKRLREFQSEAERHNPDTHIPPNLTDTPPLILALHGTGMQGDDMIKALREAADSLNMILIAPDALRPAQGGGFSWTYRDESEWMVNHIIQTAIQEHQINPEQVYLVGFSQGANIAFSMGQTHPNLFAGIIPICGHYEPQIAEPDQSQTPAPVYLMTGARDPWKKTYAAAKRDFTKSDIPVTMRVVPGIGHEIPKGQRGIAELIRAIKWCQDNQPTDQDQPESTQTPERSNPTDQP
ncbi:MAG: alpha/beta fold hydrolase [Phycisphaerales bacterium]|nr:alpha/beta fold hydrolase [Phycisphaerales bacterium]